jgi:hypothetical protein
MDRTGWAQFFAVVAVAVVSSVVIAYGIVAFMAARCP